jgi:type I restriction enzyme S subunit
MNKLIKNGMVPKLRFPEFLDAEEWKEITLGQIADYDNGKAHENDISETGRFIVVNSKFISTDGEVKKFTNTAYCIANKENILMVLSDLPNGRALAKCFFVDADDLYTVNQRICKITPIKAVGLMLFYTLNRNLYFLAFDDGVNQTNLKKDDVLNCPLVLPKDQKEQQKIADCLSSLDDLITAHNQKLDTLKVHKKGMMQQLFPGEGETLPKLRFAEFRDEGEWEEKKFGELCKFTRGPFGGSLKKEIFVNDGYAVYEQSHAIYSNFDSFRYYITEDKFNELKRFSVLPNDIIMSCSGTMGKFAIVPRDSKKGVINQALLKLTVKKGYDLRFIKATLEFPINQEKLLSQSAGGAIKNVVSVDQIKEIGLYIPSLHEQQKIADCLSSIDELITAQSVKLEALKAHKKGLMQQLFPNIDDNN